MPQITLETVLSELIRLNAKIDTGFAEVRTEFNNIRKEMTAGFAEVRKEMTAGFAEVRREMDTRFAEVRREMDTGFAEVRKDIKGISQQLAQTHVEVTDLRARVSILEGPSA